MRPLLSSVVLLALCSCGSNPAALSEADAPDEVLEELPDRFTRLVVAEPVDAETSVVAGAPAPKARPRPRPASTASREEVAEDLGLSGGIGGLIGGGTAEGLGGLGTKGLGMGGGGSFGSGASGYGMGSGSSGHGIGSGSSAVISRPSMSSQPTRPLRAGSTDDNAAFDAYLSYLDAEQGHGRLGRLGRLDVRDRSSIRVLDRDGEPVPSASVRVLNDGALVWEGQTYGDGRVPYYPHQFGQRVTRVEVAHQGQSASETWGGVEELTLRVDVEGVQTVRMDVALVLDTTGSMSDELAAIKASLRGVTERLKSDGLGVDIRFGAVLYRDVGDAYVTRAHGFSDLESFETMLAGVEAGGGGDTPEALHEALDVAVSGLSWREDVARVAFVIADAPPHLENGRSHADTAAEALSEGIRVHTVAASGLDQMGSLVFRRVAQLTRGKFIFIEYGGDVSGSAAAHGVSGQVESNNLDAILYRELKAELSNWGRWTL